ncbi:MAG: bifunctional 3,4-dihydroxy-2-butanone-4-phosphate synthase/GTP cyclohydrolase II [Burkholderiaceae bacterium]
MLTAVPNPSKPPARLATTPELIDEIRHGRVVVLVDDEDRENEGDLIFAADFVTPEKINFLAKYGRGLICMPITAEHAAQLQLAPMTANNRTVHGTNFTVAIEAAAGISTGISAADRAHTIRVATRPNAKPSDVVQPGHVFPLVAAPGGVLMRAGHTEACCDLARLAGLNPAAVLCEVMNDDGTMARLPDLLPFAAAHGLRIGTIADLIRYRAANETLVERVSARRVMTSAGEFELIAYRDQPSGSAHLALVHGDLSPEREALVRVHEPLSVLDVLDVEAPTHAWPVFKALKTIASSESGVLVMLNCGESAQQLFAHLDAMMTGESDEARSSKLDLRKLDLRTYGVGAQILRDLNVRRMKLLARPRKMPSMAGFGLQITGYLED